MASFLFCGYVLLSQQIKRFKPCSMEMCGTTSYKVSHFYGICNRYFCLLLV